MEVQEMVKKLHNNINSASLSEHEQEYVEKMYMKLIYSRRPAEPAEIKTIKRLYQLYLARSIK